MLPVTGPKILWGFTKWYFATTPELKKFFDTYLTAPSFHSIRPNKEAKAEKPQPKVTCQSFEKMDNFLLASGKPLLINLSDKADRCQHI